MARRRRDTGSAGWRGCPQSQTQPGSWLRRDSSQPPPLAPAQKRTAHTPPRQQPKEEPSTQSLAFSRQPPIDPPALDFEFQNRVPGAPPYAGYDRAVRTFPPAESRSVLISTKLCCPRDAWQGLLLCPGGARIASVHRRLCGDWRLAFKRRRNHTVNDRESRAHCPADASRSRPASGGVIRRSPARTGVRFSFKSLLRGPRRTGYGWWLVTYSVCTLDAS